MRHAVATRVEEKVKPAFTVTELEGERTMVVHQYNNKEKKIVSKTINVPAGYMVKFAKGHSVRMDKKGLDRLMRGDPTIRLVDLEKDEVVGSIPNPMAA